MGINKALGHAKFSFEHFWRNHKIKAHVGMAERLARELVIEEALQMEKKLHSHKKILTIYCGVLCHIRGK